MKMVYLLLVYLLDSISASQRDFCQYVRSLPLNHGRRHLEMMPRNAGKFSTLERSDREAQE